MAATCVAPARWADIVDDDDETMSEQARERLRTSSIRHRLRTDSDLNMPMMPSGTSPVLTSLTPPFMSPALAPELPPASFTQWPAAGSLLSTVPPQSLTRPMPVMAQSMPAENQEERATIGANITAMKAPPQEELQTTETTVCFRNLPKNYTTEMVQQLLDTNGLKGMYDFVYVPHDITRLPSLVNVGYFYVNFDSPDIASRAWGNLCSCNDVVSEFTIRLTKSDGKRLGVDVNPSDGKSLLIESLHAEGLVADWNLKSSDLKIKVGDHVVKVNNAHGSAQAIASACATSQKLQMTIRRRQALSATWATKTFVRSFVKCKGTCPLMHQDIPAECKPIFVKSGAPKYDSVMLKVPGCVQAQVAQIQDVNKFVGSHSRSSSRSTTEPTDAEGCSRITSKSTRWADLVDDDDDDALLW